MKQIQSYFSRTQFGVLRVLFIVFLLGMVGCAAFLMWQSGGVLSMQRAAWVGAALIANLLIFAAIMRLVLQRVNQLVMARQSTEEALRMSEQRHRALLDAIPDIVLRRKQNGVYTDFKPAKHFGRCFPQADFIGRNMSEFLPPDVTEASMAASERALASGEDQAYQYRMPHRQTGELRDYEGRVLPVNQDEVQVIIRDITEEKIEVTRAQQAQKLESLGLLAGGVAHDFNNLLTGILAQLSLAKLKHARGLTPIDQINKAATTSERAADLTRQLLAYTGKGKFQIAALDLNELVRDTTGLFAAALPNRAELQLHLADKLPAVKADRSQLQQVMINLVLNAAEALNSGRGCIQISTNLQDFGAMPEFRHYIGEPLHEGEYVALQVRDNGCGMEQTHIQQIFDPFFSTKPTGHGLGLASALGIMRTHHGGVSVDSEPGAGSIFTLFFPATAEQVAAPAVLEIAPTPHNYLSQPTILIIDDEATIREAVADALNLENIALLSAASGAEGIELFRHKQDQIDLILLDMKMPGLSGEETLYALVKIDPAAKVILSSGYTEEEIDHLCQETTVVGFLPKPYDFAQLTTYIHNALQAAPGD